MEGLYLLLLYSSKHALRSPTVYTIYSSVWTVPAVYNMEPEPEPEDLLLLPTSREDEKGATPEHCDPEVRAEPEPAPEVDA